LVVKRVYDIRRQKGSQAKRMIAALRSNEQVTDLCGADLIMSIRVNGLSLDGLIISEGYL
jgi:hypothetical protein